MNPSNKKVIDRLAELNPRLLAEITRDLAIDAASQQGCHVDYLRARLDDETDKLTALRAVADAAKNAFDREFPADGVHPKSWKPQASNPFLPPFNRAAANSAQFDEPMNGQDSY